MSTIDDDASVGERRAGPLTKAARAVIVKGGRERAAILSALWSLLEERERDRSLSGGDGGNVVDDTLISILEEVKEYQVFRSGIEMVLIARDGLYSGLSAIGNDLIGGIALPSSDVKENVSSISPTLFLGKSFSSSDIYAKDSISAFYIHEIPSILEDDESSYGTLRTPVSVHENITTNREEEKAIDDHEKGEETELYNDPGDVSRPLHFSERQDDCTLKNAIVKYMEDDGNAEGSVMDVGYGQDRCIECVLEVPSVRGDDDTLGHARTKEKKRTLAKSVKKAFKSIPNFFKKRFKSSSDAVKPKERRIITIHNAPMEEQCNLHSARHCDVDSNEDMNLIRSDAVNANTAPGHKTTAPHKATVEDHDIGAKIRPQPLYPRTDSSGISLNSTMTNDCDDAPSCDTSRSSYSHMRHYEDIYIYDLFKGRAECPIGIPVDASSERAEKRVKGRHAITHLWDEKDFLNSQKDERDDDIMEGRGSCFSSPCSGTG